MTGVTSGTGTDIFLKHLNSAPVLSEVCVAQSLVFIVHNVLSSMVCLFVPFLLIIVLSVLPGTGRDRMVVGFTTTYPICTYHH